MSSIIARFTSSLMGLMGESASSASVGSRMEEIREEMLGSMLELLPEPAPQSMVWDKVLYAPSIQTLWYLRLDLMALLSEHCGETVAGKALSNITERFRGVLPANQMSKSNRFCH
jgi:hypothetical protein